MLPERMDKHISELKQIAERLLDQTLIPYSKATPSGFPELRGVYVITTSQGEVIRAGQTGRGNATLRQRLYQNHLMGSQNGNLRKQLVASGRCKDIEAAKSWIREECSARYLVIDDRSDRANIEHFILAALQPEFCDNNQFLGEN